LELHWVTLRGSRKDLGRFPRPVSSTYGFVELPAVKSRRVEGERGEEKGGVVRAKFFVRKTNGKPSVSTDPWAW